jgi:Set1/Ash2 histone methyltransferase complex subunit ASH2
MATAIEGNVVSKKRRLSPTPDTPALSPAFIHTASQAAAGFPATQSALVTGVIPTVQQVQTSAKKMVQEVPPIVHLSKTDTAPQLKIENYLTVKGGMRGYRTSRATHGVNSGDYYFECLVQQGPSVDEIKNLLPPNVRLAPKLKQQLQTGENVGGHTRIGWSMRLGDLQAPVGYDKWSYGYRDIQGSRVHNSRREDVWGSEPYGPGDIVGFAISTELNQIHFFRNGEAMGHFVISKGKREGGAAFEDIADGTYYPAISVFLGGTVRANFGPHFVYNPRKLPHGVKVKPMSELCEKPPTVDSIQSLLKQLPKKTDDSLIKALEEALKAEADVRNEAYQQHYAQHVSDVKRERGERNLSVNDLE